ncbi:MAG: SprT family zinc-dependent metalloprotease [Bacteroidota bacterium]
MKSGSERRILEVSGLAVEVVRKDIQNLHLAVYPPDGRVRIAVPRHVDDDAARLAVVDKLRWIRRQQADFARQPRQSRREVVTGESHYLWGRRYRLDVVEQDRTPLVRVRGPEWLELTVRSGTNADRRLRVLTEWYRSEIKARVPALVAAWEPVLGVRVADWGVRRMKTKWGSCSIDARRIWLNLELAKKPPTCLEYIVVHEMVHLLERRHTERFRALMDRHLPDWQLRRAVLNRAPLAHEDWTY